MGQGYTRNDGANNIANGNVIDAADLDGEFDAIVDSFASATGHTHDGTAAEGGAITVVGPAQDIITDATAIYPKTDAVYDLGKVSSSFDVAYVESINLAGTALTASATEINYTDGVTSAIQTQLNNKQPLNSVLTNTTASFLVADESKLDGIEAGADVTDTANVTAAGALMDSEVDADIKTLSLPANTTISTFGKSLINDTAASTARTTLGLGSAATTASTAYATSAQGTKADAALPRAGGAMTGAITTNSTFDGRDVATDGTKLDGIESGADVTDTANVTAAGALMDSEVDADIKTLVLPASTTISTYGRTLVDDTTAANARGTLGLGSLATSNTTLGNLATSNASVGTGNLRNLNAVNLANNTTGTLDRDKFEGYVSSTGITVNNSTGNIATNITQNNTSGNLNAVNLATSTTTAGNIAQITSSAGNNVRLNTAGESLLSINANNTNRDLALTFNGNTPGSGNLRNSNTSLGNLASSNATVGTGNLRNSNTVLGNLATSNVTLGNLATSNASVGTGNLRNLNAVNLANNTTGTLDRDKFEGYNSGTGISVNNSTGAITSNATGGDETLPLFDGSVGTGNISLSNGNGNNTILAGSTNGRYFSMIMYGQNNNWPTRTVFMNGANSWMRKTSNNTASVNYNSSTTSSPMSIGANNMSATGYNGYAAGGMYLYGFIQAGTNMSGSGQSVSKGVYWDA